LPAPPFFELTAFVFLVSFPHVPITYEIDTISAAMKWWLSLDCCLVSQQLMSSSAISKRSCNRGGDGERVATSCKSLRSGAVRPSERRLRRETSSADPKAAPPTCWKRIPIDKLKKSSETNLQNTIRPWPS
jgi:hypothetical protein